MPQRINPQYNIVAIREGKKEADYIKKEVKLILKGKFLWEITDGTDGKCNFYWFQTKSMSSPNLYLRT